MGNNPIVFGDPDGGKISGGPPTAKNAGRRTNTPTKGKPGFDWGQVGKVLKEVATEIKEKGPATLSAIGTKVRNFDPDKAYIAMQGTDKNTQYEGRKGLRNGAEVMDNTSKAYNATIYLSFIGKPMGFYSDGLKTYADFDDAYMGYMSYPKALQNAGIRLVFGIGGEYLGNKLMKNHIRPNDKIVDHYDAADVSLGFASDVFKDKLIVK